MCQYLCLVASWNAVRQRIPKPRPAQKAPEPGSHSLQGSKIWGAELLCCLGLHICLSVFPFPQTQFRVCHEISTFWEGAVAQTLNSLCMCDLCYARFLLVFLVHTAPTLIWEPICHLFSVCVPWRMTLYPCDSGHFLSQELAFMTYPGQWHNFGFVYKIFMRESLLLFFDWKLRTILLSQGIEIFKLSTTKKYIKDQVKI